MAPTRTHDLNPLFSITHNERKLHGRYISKSAYFAIYNTPLDASGYAFVMIGRLVLSDACTIPVEAEVRKNASSTIHRYGYRIYPVF